MTRTVVDLLRHARAHPRERQEDGERPLDEAGQAQAAALARLLTGAEPPVAVIATGPALRCRQTVAPLAEALGLDARVEPALDETREAPVVDGGDDWVAAAWSGGRALALLDRLVAEHAGGRVLLCTHGDVVSALLALLAGRDGLGVSDVRCRPGGRVALDLHDGRCRSAALLDPP